MTEKNEKAIEELKKTTNQVEAIAKHLSFGSIDPFPYGLLDVVKLLKEYSKDEETKENKNFCLDIYTDVPGYAIFGHNKLWNEYYDCLNEICTKLKTDFPIHWYFYTENHIKNQIREQFSNWKTLTLDELRDEIYIRSGHNEKVKNKEKYQNYEEIRLNYRHKVEGCRYCNPESNSCHSIGDEECKIIIKLQKEVDELRSNEEVSKFVEEEVFTTMEKLHKHAIERINALSTNGGVVRYEKQRLDENLPFFAWIILQKTEGKEEFTPVEGIVSYNYYDEKNEAIEKGFRTSDQKLIRSLFDIVHSNSIQQMKRQEEQKKDKGEPAPDK